MGMRTPKGTLKGRKISDRHSSVIPDAVAIIKTAKAISSVSKVVLCHIVQLGGGKRRIKFSAVQAGLRVVVRGSASQQTLFIYTNNPAEIESALRHAWEIRT